MLTSRQCFHEHRLTPGTPITIVANPVQLYTHLNLILCTRLQASQDQL